MGYNEFGKAPQMAKDLILEQKTGIDAISTEIRRIEQESLAWDKKSNRGCLGGVLALIAVVVCFVYGVDAEFPDSAVGGLSLFGGIFLICFIYFWVAAAQMWKTKRLPALKAILDAIEADLAPGEGVELKADCRGLDDEAHCVEKKGGGLLSSTEERRYSDPWLNLRFKTIDGSTVLLAAEEELKKKIKYKRKGRTKTRARKNMKVRVKVVASPKSFAGIRKGVEAMAGKQVNNVKVSAARVDGRSLSLTTTATDQRPEWLVLRTLSLAYGQLQPLLGTKVQRKLQKTRKTPAA